MARVSDSKLLSEDTPSLKPEECSIVVVRTEWNAAIVDALEKGCLEQLRKSGVRHIQVYTVPGAVEIPFTIRSFWENRKYKAPPHAFIALGCVIRGETPHFDYVCKAVTEGVLQLNLHLPIPTIFGVLTVDNTQQAEDRIGGKHGQKGQEAAVTALKMISLVQQFKKVPNSGTSSL